jgi:hypothetical protein
MYLFKSTNAETKKKFYLLDQWFSTFLMLRHLLTPNFCSRHTKLFKTMQKQNRLIKKKVITLGRTITDNINQLITVTKQNILSFLIKICIYLVFENLIRLSFPYSNTILQYFWWHRGEFWRHTNVSRHPVWETLP